ncbi:MAG TPA: hypothetical protein VEG27_10935 [Usitatibacter sp.]|nr:hypothetical protein [Usitatibacter sp.]
MSLRGAALGAAFLLAIVPGAARCAASGEAITPLNQSVAGGESQDFSVRFLDASGHASVGESVTFANDACGTFANGLTQTTATTDATGVATARFTAFPQGITCWLVAIAGAAEVQFNVLTYIPADVHLSAALPPRILPGTPFTFRGAAMYGAYALYGVDISARVVAGTSSASISPAQANSGQDGMVTFTVTPDARGGDYQIELQFRDRVQRFAVAPSPAPWQDLWWAGPAENGWGMSIVQHAATLFSVIYAYDAAGEPTWYVMPGGSWNAAGTVYSGALYRPRGSPYTAYDVSRFVPGDAVGGASLDFGDPLHVALSYTIDGTSGSKSLVRQPFGPVDASGGIDVGDMWWGGLEQDGWGLALLQQYRSVFGVWFTYDASGAPTWFVMPAGTWSDAQTWRGTIYRTTGSPWLGQPYDASALRTTAVGTFALRFSDGAGAAAFDYAIGAGAGSVPIVRQPF